MKRWLCAIAVLVVLCLGLSLLLSACGKKDEGGTPKEIPQDVKAKMQGLTKDAQQKAGMKAQSGGQ